jgi:2'-5' RNA ligase
VRSFIALEVPPLAPELPWPRPPERHLTLRFLGEVDPERVPALIGAIRAAVEGTAPFEVEYRSAGFFPPSGAPRVAWVGVGEGRAELLALAGRLEAALGPLGWAPEGRGFHPHVTFYRLRGREEALRLQRFIDGLGDRPLGRARVTEVILFSSQLGAGGARHTALERVPLPGRSGASPVGAA